MCLSIPSTAALFSHLREKHPPAASVTVRALELLPPRGQHLAELVGQRRIPAPPIDLHVDTSVRPPVGRTGGDGPVSLMLGGDGAAFAAPVVLNGDGLPDIVVACQEKTLDPALERRLDELTLDYRRGDAER
jgi:hypothetical protein